MNACSFIGRLMSDPDLRTVGQTQKVTIRLGISRYFKKNDGTGGYRNVYANFEAWDSAATNINEKFQKGDFIIIDDASLEMDEWEDKNTGAKRNSLYFRINKFSRLPSPKNGGGAGEEAEAAPARTASKPRKEKAEQPAAQEAEAEIPF